MTNKEELKNVFRRADGKVNVSSGKLSTQVFAKKRQRESVAIRVLAGSIGIAIFAVFVGLSNWKTETHTEVAHSNIAEEYEQETDFDNLEGELQTFNTDWNTELLEQRRNELNAELKRLNAERNSQQLMFLREKISRTNWMDFHFDFTELTEF